MVFFIWVLFFWCLENDRHFLAGFVLALCLFKPTLVALPALMLLVGRRWREVSGFAAGGVGDGVAFHRDGGPGWLPGLVPGAGNERQYRGRDHGKADEARHQAKNVDVLAFSHLLFANWPTVAGIVSISGRHGGARLAGAGVVEIG